MARWLQEQYAAMHIVCIASAQSTAMSCASVMQEALLALHDVHVAINSKHKCHDWGIVGKAQNTPVGIIHYVG